MRLEHLTSHLNYDSSPHMPRVKGKVKQGASNKSSEHTDVIQSANKNINRPAKSVNFSGSVSSATQATIGKAIKELAQSGVKDFKGIKEPPKWAYKFLNSDGVNRGLKLVKDNEALFENIITIFLAGLLKPICVLAMPGAEEKDKQTAATKNFVAAVTGFVLSSIILTPISKGVKEVTKNLPKYIKDPEYIKLIDPKWEDTVVKIAKNGEDIMGGSLADAFSTFYKKIADLVITPTKAAITIGFMPYLLDFLFKDKNEKKEAAKHAAEKENAQARQMNIKLNENEKIFSQFRGGEAK